MIYGRTNPRSLEEHLSIRTKDKITVNLIA